MSGSEFNVRDLIEEKKLQFQEIDKESLLNHSDVCYELWREYQAANGGSRRANFANIYLQVFEKLLTNRGVRLEEIDPFTFTLDVYKILNFVKENSKGKIELVKMMAQYMGKEIQDYLQKEQQAEESPAEPNLFE